MPLEKTLAAAEQKSIRNPAAYYVESVKNYISEHGLAADAVA